MSERPARSANIPWWAWVLIAIALIMLTCVGWLAYEVLFTDWLPDQD